MQTVILSNPGTDPWVAAYKANGVAQSATIPAGAQLIVLADEAPGLSGPEAVARPSVSVRSVGMSLATDTVAADSVHSGLWAVCAVLLAIHFWKLLTP